jgi:hypothetical protein
MPSIARFGRIAFLAACAACASTGQTGSEDAEQSYPQTRIVFRQHYDQGTRLVMENYAGRRLVDLRSQVIPKGEVPIAWVPDDVMKRMVRELKRKDFDEYARPRPGDPKALGVRAEITIYAKGDGRGKALMRTHGQPRAEAESFQMCATYFREVWTEYRPKYQAAQGDGSFGVKRAGYERGK